MVNVIRLAAPYYSYKSSYVSGNKCWYFAVALESSSAARKALHSLVEETRIFQSRVAQLQLELETGKDHATHGKSGTIMIITIASHQDGPAGHFTKDLPS